MSGVDSKRPPDPTRRRMLAALGVAALTTFAFACAGIIGIDDRLPEDVTDEGGATIDRFVPDDAVVPPGACPGSAKCVAVPDGWVLTSLDPNNRPGCANGYGSPEDVVVAAADGLGCTCKCTETSPGSCVGFSGQTTPFRSYPSAGCGANSSTYNMGLFDGGCENLAVTVQTSNRVPPAAPTPPGCAADAGPTPLKSGQACLAQGASCSDGGTCASDVPDAGHLCIKKDGDEACPRASRGSTSSAPAPAPIRASVAHAPAPPRRTATHPSSRSSPMPDARAQHSPSPRTARASPRMPVCSPPTATPEERQGVSLRSLPSSTAA